MQARSGVKRRLFIHGDHACMPCQRPYVECDEGRNAGIERRITKLFGGEPHVGAPGLDGVHSIDIDLPAWPPPPMLAPHSYLIFVKQAS